MVFPQYRSLYVEFSYLIQGIQENQRLKWFYLQNGRHSSKSFSDVKSAPIWTGYQYLRMFDTTGCAMS